MPEQLVFELGRVEPPGFDNFVAGANAEIVAALRQFVAAPTDPGLVLWGGPATGKTHLLRASVAEARARGRGAIYCETPAALPPEPPLPATLMAIDAIDTADPGQQALLFTLYNALPGHGGQLICAAPLPPARLPLREDLRTRIGHGLIFEVKPLADADLPQALRVYAEERGFPLGPDVIDYLLRHRRRDVRSLTAMLAALDRHSLATRRPITVPLLRDWLAGPATSLPSSEVDAH